LEKWIDQVIVQTAEESGIAANRIRNDESHLGLIQANILRTINQMTEVGGFAFSTAVTKYYEGSIMHDDALRMNPLRGLDGSYHTKREARQDLGVREIINDLNFYDMLKYFCRLIVSMGYEGFVISLGEAVNLYKISPRTMREKNYEKLLT